MQFASIRIVTDDVDRLVTFYERITHQTAKRATGDFAEIVTPSATVAIASTRTVGMLGANAPQPSSNASIIIEFRVEDVDAEYERLRGFVTEFALEPTTTPWGNRSVLFRDPDGNLVNFFAPATPEAIRRYV